MKRNLDLFRSILLQIEESEEFYVSEINHEGFQFDVFANHLVLLEEANLIEGQLDFSEDGSLYAYEIRLTNSGYEYIALAKNNTIWKKLKTKLKEKTIDFSFDISKQILLSLAKEHIL